MAANGTLIGSRRVIGRLPGVRDRKPVWIVRFNDGTQTVIPRGSEIPGVRVRQEIEAGPVRAGKWFETAERVPRASRKEWRGQRNWDSPGQSVPNTRGESFRSRTRAYDLGR